MVGITNRVLRLTQKVVQKSGGMSQSVRKFEYIKLNFKKDIFKFLRWKV